MSHELDFPELAALLSSSEDSLPAVLSSPNFRVAFKHQFPSLTEYLIANLLGIAQLALGHVPNPSSEVVATAFYCLTNATLPFTPRFVTNKPFVNVLLSTLQDPTDYKLLSFSRIFEFVVEQTNGFVFLNVADKPGFLRTLIGLLSSEFIFELMTTLTSGVPRPVMQFLEVAQMTTVLLSSLSDDVILNCKVLKLMVFLVSKNLPSEKLLSVIVDRPNLEKLFEYLINGQDNQCSAIIGGLFLHLCDLEPCVDVIPFLQDRLPRLCAFVLKGSGYTAAASAAVGIVIRLLKKSKSDTIEEVVDLGQQLFERIFVLPGNTILHQDCLLLFACLPGKEAFIQRVKLIERIPEAFRNYRQITAVYWACLHAMTRLIVDGKVPIDETSDWKAYIAGQFRRTEVKVRNEYGGDSTEYEEDSYSYSYEEEEDQCLD